MTIDDETGPGVDAVAGAGNRAGGAMHRIGGRLLHEVREAVAPTLFFFIGFDLIVLTTNLLVAQYLVAVSNFMLATAAALVVGKGVLVANAMPFIRRYDRASTVFWACRRRQNNGTLHLAAAFEDGFGAFSTCEQTRREMSTKFCLQFLATAFVHRSSSSTIANSLSARLIYSSTASAA